MSIGVLVVGDIGRSPRMQNHAVELSRNFSKKEIYMIGYDETPCSIEFIERENINVLNLSHGGVDKLRKYLPTLVGFLIFALCKVVFQTISLFFVLIKIPRLEAIIVQSPPAIPALIVVWIACKIKKSKMIVDIHNYGYSILSLSVSNKILVKVAASIERFFVRRADITFTVSKAMSKDVFNSWGLKHAPKVLFDVPPTRFQPPTHSTIHEVLLRLLDADDLLEDQKQSIVKNLSVKMNKNIPSDLNKTFKTLPALPDKVSRDTIGFQPLPSWSSNQISILTNKNGFLPRAQNMTIAEALKSNQAPVFAISCTSWTPDEDFNILLNALVRYDRQARKTLSTLPPLLMVITGKGAMRDIFFQNAASMNMTHVALVSLFVPADLYPAFVFFIIHFNFFLVLLAVLTSVSACINPHQA